MDMKKSLLFFAFALAVTFGVSAPDALYAYIADYGDTLTNIRNAPNGKVVRTVKSGSGYVVELIKPVNGWWKIDATIEQWGDEDVEEQLEGSSTGYWVHHSVIGFTGTGEGTSFIYSKPSRKSRKICEYHELMHPVDVKGNWVKVKTHDGRYTGWIHRNNICFNPLTTCP